MTTLLTDLTTKMTKIINSVIPDESVGKVTSPLKTVVIQKYLDGLSLNEIVNEVYISKGSVFNVIQEWKASMLRTDIEEVRAFASEVRRSGMTIQQCGEGFRTAVILKRFGIKDDYDEYVIEEEQDNKEFIFDTLDTGNPLLSENNPHQPQQKITKKSDDNQSKMKTNEISYFLGIIYKHCQKEGIRPAIIIKWLEDLFYFYSIGDKEPIINNDNGLRNVNQERLRSTPEADDNIRKEIPFISRVSYFIEQKKKKIQQLEDTKRSIHDDIDQISKQKSTVLLDLKKAMEKEKRAVYYFKWYDSLRHELLTNYNLRLDDEISRLARIIDDFKEYGYNMFRILKDFSNIESLQQQKESIQRDIDLNSPIKNDLLREINRLDDQLRFSKQTMDIYQQLFSMGFGLKELKELYSNLIEISVANDIKVTEAISKFLKDIKEHYDDKLGFESKIREMKQEMLSLEAKVPEYKYFLQLQGIVSPILLHLTSNGVTNEDIIGMNNLVLEFKNSDFLSVTLNQKDNINSSSNNNSNNKTANWNVFIEKLKSLKNINLEIDKRLSNSNNLKKQIDNLNTKKQEIERLYLEAVSNLNHILSSISYLIEVTNQINEGINKKITIAPGFTPILLNLIYMQKDDRGDDPDKKEKYD